MNSISNKSDQYRDDDIAIIGMAGRFPEADSLDMFWENLAMGRDSVRPFPEERVEELKEIAGAIPQVNFIHEGYLNQIFQFEPEIFGINHEESRYMDPQQRILLELVEEAIADAGYTPDQLNRWEVGIFVTEGENMYTRNFRGSFMSFVNGLTSVSAGRIAYTYNFTGPAYIIGSACSSTLVALHTACESLRSGECECAVSGGVRLDLFPSDQSQISELPILSPDQKARAFDKAANGTVVGEGGAVLILKPLKKAMEAGDPIHAIIKGGAINSDGNRSSSLNAPSEEGQADVILKAVRQAGIDPVSISYLETHGTGTKIGDPIEIAGLTTALRQLGYPYQSVPIGSLKTNIGHLDTAAGIASVVKTVLALKRRQIPPSLHFTEPNPFIDFEKSPVYVNTRLSQWESDTVRRAGITSLGLIGTNAHVILEEAPQVEPSPEWLNVVTLSARTEYSLRRTAARLADYLGSHRGLSITDIAYTLNTGRREYRYALALTASSSQELARKLSAGDYHTCTRDLGETYYESAGGRVEARGGVQRKTLSSIFIYPGYSEENAATLAALAMEEPLKGYVEELCQTIPAGVWNDRRVQHIIYLHAFTQLLEDHGIRLGAALGFGLGEIAADLVLGNTTLQEGITQAQNYNQVMDPIMEERMGQLVHSILSEGYNSFILVAVTSPLKEIFARVAGDQASIYSFLPLRGEFQWMIMELLLQGIQIDWERGYRKKTRCRIHLPGYVFDRKRYHLKLNAVPRAQIAAAGQQQRKEAEQNLTSGQIDRQLRIFLEELEPGSSFQLHKDFEELGMDSVSIMHFAGKIRQEFGIQVPFTLFFSELNIGQILEELQGRILQNNTAAGFTIEKQPADTYLPMAPAQRVLYKMNQLNPWNGHVARAWKVEGELDRDKLEQVFRTIVERHEALRTSFEMVGGKAVQKVHSHVDFSIRHLKVSPMLVKKKIHQQVKPFDLQKPPLLRVTLVESGKENYLLYELPYIITDATALHVFVEEFFTLYEGGELPELTIHQKDYVLWREKQLETEEVQAKGRYWKELFRDGIHEINLPADQPRPEIFDGSGDRLEHWIPKPVTDRLNQLAQQQNATMNMVLLAAYNILLTKYTGINDVTVGTLVGGRTQSELQGLIGHFAFKLALRNRPTDTKSFFQFLNEVKENALKAFENQEYPIEVLMDELKMRRGPDRGPWFDCTFTYQNAKGQNRGGLPDNSLQVTPHPLEFWSVVEDFIIILMETDGGILMDLRYSTQLFKKSTIERFRDDYVSILESILENPSVTIGEVVLAKGKRPKRARAALN